MIYLQKKNKNSTKGERQCRQSPLTKTAVISFPSHCSFLVSGSFCFGSHYRMHRREAEGQTPGWFPHSCYKASDMEVTLQTTIPQVFWKKHFSLGKITSFCMPCSAIFAVVCVPACSPWQVPSHRQSTCSYSNQARRALSTAAHCPRPSPRFCQHGEVSVRCAPRWGHAGVTQHHHHRTPSGLTLVILSFVPSLPQPIFGSVCRALVHLLHSQQLICISGFLSAPGPISSPVPLCTKVEASGFRAWKGFRGDFGLQKPAPTLTSP